MNLFHMVAHRAMMTTMIITTTKTLASIVFNLEGGEFFGSFWDGCRVMAMITVTRVKK